MLSKEEVGKLRETHGELERFVVKGTEIFVRLPEELSANMLKQRVLDPTPARKAQAQAQFVRSCIVHPGPADVEALLKRAPLALDGIGNSERFQEFVGMKIEEEEKA